MARSWCVFLHKKGLTVTEHPTPPMSTTPLICHFEAIDTWFFREARPHGSVGNSELGSVFPPPVRTLVGALRTLIGDAWFKRHGGNWHGFANNKALQAIIGMGDDLGSLRCSGPFLSLNGERLYSAPANLMVKESEGKKHYFLLDLGSPVQCDLGSVYLPSFPSKVAGLNEFVGSKPAEQCWLSSAGWQQVLQGQAPQAIDVISKEQLFDEEARLGIGRDNARKSVQEGLLYQTRHLRLRPGVSVQLHLDGLQDASLLPTQTTLRLGGEGRMASLHIEASRANPACPSVKIPPQAKAFALYALTAAPCAEALPAGIPSGFQPVQHNGADVWEGEVGQQRLRILSACCTRVLREGGWDMANHQARPVQSLLAAGSVLYVQNLSDTAFDPQALCHLTDATGRALFVAGLLPTHSTFKG